MRVSGFWDSPDRRVSPREHPLRKEFFFTSDEDPDCKLRGLRVATWLVWALKRVPHVCPLCTLYKLRAHTGDPLKEVLGTRFRAQTVN